MTINGYYFVDIKSLTAIQQLTMTAHYHHFILAPIKKMSILLLVQGKSINEESLQRTSNTRYTNCIFAV